MPSASYDAANAGNCVTPNNLVTANAYYRQAIGSDPNYMFPYTSSSSSSPYATVARADRVTQAPQFIDYATAASTPPMPFYYGKYFKLLESLYKFPHPFTVFFCFL